MCACAHALAIVPVEDASTVVTLQEREGGGRTVGAWPYYCAWFAPFQRRAMKRDGGCDQKQKQSLPFQQVQHQVTSTDCHPTTNGGILVHVCGNLVVRL